MAHADLKYGQSCSRGTTTTEQLLGRRPANAGGNGVSSLAKECVCTTRPAGVFPTAPTAYQQGLEQWLKSPDKRELCDTFHALCIDRGILAVEIPAETLQKLYARQRLFFREKCIYTEVLAKISLPLDPSYLAKGNVDGPVILVKDGDKFIATNGNHRIFKVLTQECTQHSLYALVFTSRAAYERYLGTDFDPYHNNVTTPCLTHGPRRT